MTDTRTTLRKLFKEGEPVAELWIEVRERFAALRDVAAAENLDWSQIKALIKAKVEDARDGGTRVEKLLSKADNAIAYGDLLGLAGKNNFSSEPSGKTEQLRSAPEKPADAIDRASVTVNHIPAKTPYEASNVADPRLAIPDDGSIPPFLDRRGELQRAAS